MKILIILGARPQFIYVGRIHRAAGNPASAPQLEPAAVPTQTAMAT